MQHKFTQVISANKTYVVEACACGCHSRKYKHGERIYLDKDGKGLKYRPECTMKKEVKEQEAYKIPEQYKNIEKDIEWYKGRLSESECLIKVLSEHLNHETLPLNINVMVNTRLQLITANSF
jgi:hypothetical protein